MEKRYSVHEIKKKISEYKKRLYNLKLQGFTFSSDIYEDLNSVEEKISQGSIFNKLMKKKISIAIGLILILLISIIATFLFWPAENPPPSLSIDFSNAFKGMEITESFHINGTATIEGVTSFNTQNLTVHFKLDNHSEKNATAIIRENEPCVADWGFFLNISKINDGNHTLSIICSNNKDLSNIENITVIIDKPLPKVSINYPKNNSVDLSDIINISGKAIAEYSEIKEVKIQFDNGTEKNTIINNNGRNWYFTWDTRDVDNGPHSISLRCYNGEKWSKTVSINFTVFNLENWVLRDFEENELFQFVIRDSYIEMFPGKNYTLYGAHRGKKDSIFSFLSIHSYLEFPNKPDWLSIYLENNHFITPRNNEINYFTLTISITKDAKQGVYGDDFLGWKACYGGRKQLAKNCNKYLMDDIWIETGRW